MRRWVIGVAEDVFRPLRLRPHRHAHVRGDPAVHPGRGGVHRHRAQGDVHLRGPGRPQHDPASRGHRPGRPRLRRARHAHAAPAGEALVPLAHVPVREPAIGPLPAARAAGHRGLRLGIAALGRRGHRRARRPLPGAGAGGRSSCASTPWAAGRAARLRRAPARVPRGPRQRTLCGECRERTQLNPLRTFDCKVPGCRAVLEQAPAAARLPCAPRAPSTTPGSRAPWTSRASPSSRTTAGARHGLLHAHHVRVPVGRAGGPVGRWRRRTVRRPRRRHRRSADAGCGVRHRSGAHPAGPRRSRDDLPTAARSGRLPRERWATLLASPVFALAHELRSEGVAAELDYQDAV